MLSVERLGNGGIDRFREMNAIFAEVFDDPCSYAAHTPGDAYARRWLANPDNIGLLVTLDGNGMGALAGFVLNKFEQERREIYIYDLAVRKSARRQGVASLLIEELRRIARDIGAWTIFVQADVDIEDEPARRLYRKFACEEITAHHFDIAP